MPISQPIQSYKRTKISPKDFEKVKLKWSKYSSWAVWATRQEWESSKAGMGDASILDPEMNTALFDTLNPNVVFLGLNASSRDVNPEPWGNFHDGSPRAQDYKTRYALAETPLWGAYMTDVFVGLHETDSAKVGLFIRDNPIDVRRQITRLKEEFRDLGVDKPLLIAFGDKVYDVVAQLLGDTYTIEKMTHYSAPIKLDDLRQQALEIAEKYRLD